MLSISIGHARRFLVRRHLLDPPRSLPKSQEALYTVIERLGSVQFDPLEYTGARNHDLVLHARIAEYDRSLCDRALYGPPSERRLFEAYNKSLNILPIEDLPYHRIAWDRARARYDEGFFRERAEIVTAVLERLEKEGPLPTAAFRTLGPVIRWHWGPTPAGRAALEALFEAGKVALHMRDGSRRTYDLIERIFPKPLLERIVTHDEALRHRLLSRYRGVGLMGESSAAELVYGTGGKDARALLRAALIEEGVLVPVHVSGLKGVRYVLASELPILEATRKSRPSREVALIAPLDPLLWDRRLVRDLFDFDYIWEVYTPEAKRKHGYYVLPILFGDRLVGRIEPRIDRASSALQIVGLWFEEWFDAFENDAFFPALARAVSAHRRLARAEKVKLGRSKAMRALAAALNALELDERERRVVSAPA